MKNIASYLLCLFILFSFAACKKNNYSPEQIIEQYITNLKKLDSNKKIETSYVLDNDMNETQKDLFNYYLENQYLSMDYLIEKSIISTNTAVVVVSFKVLDYINTIENANSYIELNPKEFQNEDETINKYKTIEYKLNKIESCKEKKDIIIEFDLRRENDEWKMQKVSDVDILSIQGLF